MVKGIIEKVALMIHCIIKRLIMTSFDTFKDLNDDLGLNIDTQDISNKKIQPIPNTNERHTNTKNTLLVTNI